MEKQPAPIGTPPDPKTRKPKPKKRSVKISTVTLVLSVILLAFLIYVFQFAPVTLSVAKQRILAIICALLAGLLAFYLTGDMGLEITSAQTRLGKLAIKASGGMAVFVFVLVWWLAPFSPLTPDLYRVSLTVTDMQRRPVPNARVTSSLGENGKQQGAVWQFDIPISVKPSDGKVTFYAEKKDDFLAGRREFELGDDYSPSLEINMDRDKSARPMGVIVDASGKAVAGAEVWVEHHEDEKTRTLGGDRAGYFELPAHYAENEWVMLFVARPDLPKEGHWFPAGDSKAQIQLRR